MHNRTSDEKRKRIITILTAAVCLLVLIIYFIVSYADDRKTVEVVPVASISNPYWGNTVHAQGTVTNDLVQELYPDNAKVISEIFVTQGAPVKIGDPILQYDKELLELEVEKKEQDIVLKDFEIEMAQDQLKKLQNTKAAGTGSSAASPSRTSSPRPGLPGLTPGPGVSSKPPVISTRPPTIPPTIPPTVTPKPGTTPTPSQTPGTSTPAPTPTPTPIPGATVPVYKIIEANARPYMGTGESNNPYVFLCEPDYTVDPEFIQQVLGSAAYYTDPDDPSTGVIAPFAVKFEVREANSESGKLLHSFTFDGINFSGSGETDGPPANYTPTPKPPYTKATNPPHIIAQSKSNKKKTAQAESLFLSNTGGLTVTNMDTTSSTESPSPEPTETPTPSPGNSASPSATPTVTPSATPEASNYDDMGYTTSELTELVNEKIQEIASLQAQRKQMQIDLDKAKLSLDNSTVHSLVDGIVKTLIPVDEAEKEGTPFLVISGSDEYYLSTTLPETLLGKMSVGSVLTAMSYETGMSYSCEIVSIDDNPVTEDEMNYFGGNPNTSQYGCTAVIRDSDGLHSGAYLEVTLATDEVDMNALFIEKMYVREDASGSYVYKRGNEDGRLIKQYVNTGRIDGGWSIEILTDLTLEDYVAFPYGKDVKPGVRISMQGDENAFGEGDSGDIEGGSLTDFPFDGGEAIDPEDNIGGELDGDFAGGENYDDFGNQQFDDGYNQDGLNSGAESETDDYTDNPYGGNMPRQFDDDSSLQDDTAPEGGVR